MTEKTKPIASLSRMGWITDIYPMVDRMMTYWVRSDKRQNPLIPNSVFNLQWLLHQYNGDITGLCGAITSNLYTYFSNYFDDVSVNCVQKNKNQDGTSIEYHLSVSISFHSEGKLYEVSRILATDGVLFKRFVRDNNEGVS